jgi:predicted TIM-barrel fold metal-dependent hydrolase
MKYTNKIDFQAHYLPRAYYDFLEKEGLYCPDGFPTPEWNETIQQESMKTLGISYALLSLSSPSLYTGNKFRSRETARRINEEGAEIAAHSPGNLNFLAALPLPHLHSSIFEARYCLDELHAAGVGLMTNYGGVYLGDQRLDELMQELDDRGALAVMHPTQPAVVIPNVNEEIPIPAFEFFVETTRTFLNMVQNDTFTRYPNIRWVIPHAGAFLSVLADRFESFALMLRFADPNRRADIMEDMAHVYYDVAGFSEQKQLEMLLRNVDETHLLYGSDTPYTDITACIGQTRALENTAKLTDRQKQLIFTDNATALLGLEKSRH